MSQEQNTGTADWWNELSFPGKELFRMDEDGTLRLLPNDAAPERVIATIAADSREDTLKNLQEKYTEAEARVRELETEWVATEDKLKLAEKVSQIKEYLGQLQAVGNYQPLIRLVHEWEHTLQAVNDENYAEKVKLVEMAESLAQSTEWKEASQAYRDISEKWRVIAQTNRTNNGKLWHRIETARKTFKERLKVHEEDQEKEMLHNLDLKIEIVEKAEAIAASEEWKKTAEAFQQLTEEWKKTGPTVNKRNEELWRRFSLAKKVFFDRKREHTKKVQEELDKNYEIKKALVEKAEQLKDSTHWGRTAQALAGLMEEWKKTGRVAHEKSDELWKRFTEANDVFFEAKRKHFDGQRSAQEQNYELKKALLERAEEIKDSKRWLDTADEMAELLEEWKKIGPVPRSYGDTLWEEFNAARKHFFDRKAANREQRRQYQDYQNASREKEAKETRRTLQDQIKEEEERLADFKNGLENITPGKKANELRAHLENLIVETTERLKQLKQKDAHGHRDGGAATHRKEPATVRHEEGAKEGNDDEGEHTA